MKNRKISLPYLVIFVISSFLLVFAGFLVRPQDQPVHALSVSELRQQAKDLESQISANTSKLNDLNAQADTLQNKLAELETQINQVNAQIQLTTVKINQLEVKLQETQAELVRQKDLLRAAMRVLYKKQGASTVELLAGSDTFSDFINEQEYLQRIKDAVQSSTERVIELKAEIEQQQAQQQQLLDAQKGQKDTLASKQQEQQVLLDATKGQAANFKSVNEQLRQQQASINAEIIAASSSPGSVDYTLTTSYPWANYEPWSFDSCYPDPWGMCVRQCVSYAAWKVAQSGRKMPNWGGVGNANQWDDNARMAGIPVDNQPRAGDVAISNGGFYGHAMYVEAVLSDGRIHVSQFNYELQGKYSEMTIYPGKLVFIHFP